MAQETQEGMGDLNDAPVCEVAGDYQHLDFPEYTSDDFRVNSFKVVPCSKRVSHDWTNCPYAHPGEKARRRDHQQCKYAAIACIDMKNDGVCPRGEDCPYAHNVFEYWMHPTRYRTQLCHDGVKCRRKICFFAHKSEELRKPPHKPGFPADWHKGKKHGRSKSHGSTKSSKRTDSQKSHPKLRMVSAPTEIPVANPPVDSELFKSKSFNAGQFQMHQNLIPRRSVEGALESIPGIRLSEAWDLEGSVSPMTLHDSTPYSTSQPLASPWQGPSLQRRSIDATKMEPSIPENTVPLLTPQPSSGDANVSYLLHHLLQQAGCGLGDPIAASMAPSQMDIASFGGCVQETEDAVKRASFDSAMSAHMVRRTPRVEPTMAFPVQQDESSILNAEMACQQWHCGYPPYPMMTNETELVNQMGLMSMSGSVESNHPATAYGAGYQVKDAQSGVPMAY